MRKYIVKVNYMKFAFKSSEKAKAYSFAETAKDHLVNDDHEDGSVTVSIVDEGTVQEAAE